MNNILKIALSYSLAAVLVVLSACDDDTLAPFQPEVTNTADNFQMQATGVRNVSFDRTYSWSNSGQQATVNHSTTKTAGTARLTIRDAGGAVVYDKALAPSLNEATATGTSGTWTIRVHLSQYSGTLNFRVQKL